jgi:transcriptional regulator with XRE-family HTH domain
MTVYHLVTNSVQPQQVRETDGAFVIEDVPFVKPMHLSGGYVPERSIEETAPLWDGAPATLRHARDASGRPIAANRKPEIHLGVAEDPTFDGEFVRANIRIQKDRLDAVDGGDAVRDKLESGEQIDVSSQYAARDLPPGEYDGAMRENVEKITRPDSIAILPDQRGKCSIEQGCGIDPQLVANAEVSVPMTRANATHDGEDMDAAADAEFEVGDLVRWRTQASPGTGRVARVVTESGEAVESEADVENPPTRVASEDEPAYKLDDWIGEEFAQGQVVKSGSEILGRWEDAPEAAMQANATSFRLTEVSPEAVADGPGFTDEPWDGDVVVADLPNPSEDDDAADVLDQTMAAVPADQDAREAKANWKLPFRAGTDAPVNTRALVAIDGALSGARNGVEDLSQETRAAIDEWVNAMLVAAPGGRFGSLDEQSANVFARIGRQVTEALGLSAAESDSQQTMPAEPGADPVTVIGNAETADSSLVTTLMSAIDDATGEDTDQADVVDEIADAAGIEDGTVNSILRGDIECPPPDRLAGFAEALGVSESELMDAANTDGCELSSNAQGSMKDRATKIDEITSNSAITAESLKDACDERVEKLHEDVVANGTADDGGEDLADRLDSIEEQMVTEDDLEDVVANTQDKQKESELAEEIVANSAEYDDTEEVREDYPTVAALEAKHDQLTQPSGAPPAGGLEANLGGDDDVTDEYDVGTGVLTE